MSVLAGLTRHYERLAARDEVAQPGYAPASISFEIVIDASGEPIALNDLRDHSHKKPRPRSLPMPAPPKRTVAIAPTFLWDKTAYVLGVIADVDAETKAVRPTQGRRTAQEHAAFVEMHKDTLAGTDDDGLVALLSFLGGWSPDRFEALGWNGDALDTNVVFRLKGDETGGRPRRLHERPAARAVWRRLSANDADTARCLVTGEEDAVARLHPSLKGVVGAQSSGASLVSFNLPAFESYGQKQGDNAPVSTRAAHAYGTALNALLAKDGRNVRVGDTTIVYWSEAGDDAKSERRAEATEGLLAAGAFGAAPAKDDDAAPGDVDLQTLAEAMDRIATGQGVEVLGADLDPATRVHLLGLAPNNARLAVRFHHDGTFGDLARNLVAHWSDMGLEPRRWSRVVPPAWQLVQETAVHVEGADGRWKRVGDPPPRLAAEFVAAVLSGARYPRTLTRLLVGRIRAERGRVTERRAALLLAAHNRDARIENGKGLPMGLDEDETDEAYLLGRLFALYEWAEDAASGGRKAALRDRYFAAASATPARIFATLAASYTHDLAKLRKGEGKGLAVRIEREIGAAMGKLPPHLPRTLSLERQVPFSIGYYHQAQERYRKRTDEPTDPVNETEESA